MAVKGIFLSGGVSSHHEADLEEDILVTSEVNLLHYWKMKCEPHSRHFRHIFEINFKWKS